MTHSQDLKTKIIMLEQVQLCLHHLCQRNMKSGQGYKLKTKGQGYALALSFLVSISCNGISNCLELADTYLRQYLLYLQVESIISIFFVELFFSPKKILSVF
jgi:hypothetical protein